MRGDPTSLAAMTATLSRAARCDDCKAAILAKQERPQSVDEHDRIRRPAKGRWNSCREFGAGGSSWLGRRLRLSRSFVVRAHGLRFDSARPRIAIPAQHPARLPSLKPK